MKAGYKREEIRSVVDWGPRPTSGCDGERDKRGKGARRTCVGSWKLDDISVCDDDRLGSRRLAVEEDPVRRRHVLEDTSRKSGLGSAACALRFPWRTRQARPLTTMYTTASSVSFRVLHQSKDRGKVERGEKRRCGGGSKERRSQGRVGMSARELSSAQVARWSSSH